MTRQMYRSGFHFTTIFLLCAVQTEIYSHPYYFMPTRNIYISHLVTVPQHQLINPYNYHHLYENPHRFVHQSAQQNFEIDNSISYTEAPEETKHEDIRKPMLNGNTLIVHGGMNRRACQGYHDRVNPISGSCETLGTQGSCGDLMIFVGNEETNPEDRTYGHCECDYDRYAHPLVSVGGQCHFLFTQATCLPGYWLTMSTSLGPVCRVNPCEHTSSWQMGNTYNGSGFEKRVFTALYQGKCVEIDSPASNILCSGDNEVVTFVRGSLEPKCMAVVPPPRIRRRQITRPHQVACGPGMIRINEKCMTIFVVEVDDDDDEA